jgi:hypothetical protein
MPSLTLGAGGIERVTSVIYYILPFSIWATFCTWKVLCGSQTLRLFDYFFALPLILLPVLRGEVGTDTPNYIANAQGIIWWNGQRTIDVEIGYVLLVRLLATLTSDPRLVVAVLSLLAVVLFFTMLHMWGDGQCITSLVFIPLCYFSFTMNTLRVGIAFPLAVIAILQLEKKRFVPCCILALVSISVQLTAVILLPMLLLARRGAKISVKEAMYGLLIGAIILYLGYYIFGELIAYKALSYSLPPLLESNSGTGPLLMSFACSIIAIWLSEKRRRYLGLIFFAIQVTFFGVTQVSYAGLRLQAMALFAQLLALSYCAKRPIGMGQLAVVVLLCCMVFCGTARNFIASAGEPSAFIPYYFAWESR